MRRALTDGHVLQTVEDFRLCHICPTSTSRVKVRQINVTTSDSSMRSRLWT